MSELIPRLEYTRNWEDPADFATHQSGEVQNRRDIMSLFWEIRHYLNDIMLPAAEQTLGGGGGSGGGGTVTGGPYLPLAGGPGNKMQGALYLHNSARNPTAENEAAAKFYVDTKVGGLKVTVDGHTSLIEQAADKIRTLVSSLSSFSTIEQTADEIVAAVVNMRNGVNSLFDMLAHEIHLQVSAPFESGGQVYSSITLTLGPDPDNVLTTGQILMTGNVDISGQLSAEAIYANYGEVGDLEVDALSTARKIPKYLAHNTGDVNFIRIKNQYIEFVTASVLDGEPTVQARNPAGALLYWPVDVTNLARTQDGYPVTGVDGQTMRVFTTTNQTEFPVLVYQYEESVKRSICFEENHNSHIYEPIDVFGAGNDQGYNIGKLYKSPNGMELSYVSAGGNDIGVFMSYEGFVDIKGLRKCTRLDFSNWDNGSFTETVSGRQSPYQYNVVFDSAGFPVRIAAGNDEMEIDW